MSASAGTPFGLCRICTRTREVRAINVIGDAPAAVCKACCAERFGEVAR